MFASQTSKTIPIPEAIEPGGKTAVVRKLTGAEEERAQEQHAKGRGWARTFALAVAGQESVLVHDPLAGYDRLTMCQAGIVSWTAETKLTPKSVSSLFRALVTMSRL